MARYGTKTFWSNWSRAFFPEAGTVTAETAVDGALANIPTEDIERVTRRYIRELTRRVIFENEGE